MRKLNDQYKNQIKKRTTENKEYDIMKLKMTEIEAKMVLF